MKKRTFVVGKLVRRKRPRLVEGCAYARIPVGGVTNNPSGTCPIGRGASGTSRLGSGGQWQ